MRPAYHTITDQTITHKNGDRVWSNVNERSTVEDHKPKQGSAEPVELNPPPVSDLPNRNPLFGPDMQEFTEISVETAAREIREQAHEAGLIPPWATGFAGAATVEPGGAFHRHPVMKALRSAREQLADRDPDEEPEVEFHSPAFTELADWWRSVAEQEIERTVPKSIEYSATDLADIGHVLARTAGRKVSDEEAAELGVFFYILGKLSRWQGAIIDGRRPSDDTLFDIGIYIRMVQRIRVAGSWPGLDL